MEKVFEIYIRTTPERLWEAITDPEIRAKYNFGAGVECDWKPGRTTRWRTRTRGIVLGEGEILEVDPPRRLVQTHDRAVERRREVRGHVARHVGDRAGRATRAASPSRTTNCARARTTSSTAAGR